MGWMSNWDYAMVVPTEKWRSAMTLPRTLVLQKTTSGLRLASNPVKETERLRGKKINILSQTLSGTLDLGNLFQLNPSRLELELEFVLPENTKPDLSIVLSNSKLETYKIGFDAAAQTYYSDRTQSGNLSFSTQFATKKHMAPRFQTGKTLKMHVLLDVASCELFADDGSVVLTDIFFPTEDFQALKLMVSNGTVQLKSGVAYPLK
jgi:fructan beta-fructosidase